MNWLTHLPQQQPIAYAVVVLAAVIVLGLCLGGIKIGGFQLGIAGVLFVGITVSHFGLTIPPELLGFVRDFGLILFVYTIGMQVGPGFITSLRKQGLPLNLLAAAIVFLGGGLTLLLAWLLHIDIAAAVGIFAGATTNTPALGAAQEALQSIPNMAAERAGFPALGYAVAYPFGILGIILAMILVRSVLRIDSAREVALFEQESKSTHEPVERINLEVTNPNLNGLKLHQVPGLATLGVVVSRIRHAGESVAQVADSNTIVHLGDVLLAVGPRHSLKEFQLSVGTKASEDLTKIPGPVTLRRIILTNKEILGRTLRELALTEHFSVTVTRVTRADIEMSAVPDLKLQFGDMLQTVGAEADINKAASVLGNSLKELNHTNLIPVFIGVLLGIVVGLYPFSLPGVPTPLRLGLAGGPLIVAIILSRIGRIGPIVWRMPVNANILLRELGIALFLACAGLKAGEHFFEVLVHGQGILWMASGAVITLVPLLLVAFLGRTVMKLNFVNLCGLLSGSMTDPPALAFANAINKSDAPSVAYATVYPFTMLLRILVAQLLILLFGR